MRTAYVMLRRKCIVIIHISFTARSPAGPEEGDQRAQVLDQSRLKTYRRGTHKAEAEDKYEETQATYCHQQDDQEEC